MIVWFSLQDAMTHCMQSRQHQYIFEPVCASVLLRRNTSKEPLRSRNSPRIEGQVQLQPMSLRLSQVPLSSFFFKDFACSSDLYWKCAETGNWGREGEDTL